MPKLTGYNCLENVMSLGTLLLIVLILMLIGVIPTWPHSQAWGYMPSTALGIAVLVILVLLLIGRL
jgi:low affinity Fe/Cu permease